MATILEFRRRQATGLQRALFQMSAQIVFFPGVRYERVDDMAATKIKKRSRRRDRIEIED